MRLTFVTGNDIKFNLAQSICAPLGVTLGREQLEIEEIQSDQAEKIAQRKAAEAFKQLGQSLVVSDDSWLIPGLNNWPGPYMKYMNDWLTAEDFLRLTAPLTDRRVILRQVIAYDDGKQQKTFTVDVEGKLLSRIRGASKYPSLTIFSFDGDASDSEADDAGYLAIVKQHNAWRDLVTWLKAS
jgi:XTP/dITP diphosphohydrolase